MEQFNLLRMLELSDYVKDPSLVYSQLEKYSEELSRIGKFINLSGYSCMDEILNQLVYSSIEPLLDINVPRGTFVADIGSGQGIPGIPLSIVRPDLDVVLFEVREKRVAFLKHAVRLLGCNCQIEKGRIEEVAHSSDYKEKFGLVVARAFAPLYVAVECGAPLLQRDGIMYVYGDENVVSQNILTHVERVGMAALTEKNRSAKKISESGYAFQKYKDTPPEYPRKFSVMKRESSKILGDNE